MNARDLGEIRLGLLELVELLTLLDDPAVLLVEKHVFERLPALLGHLGLHRSPLCWRIRARLWIIPKPEAQPLFTV